MTATYTNQSLNESYKLNGVKSLEHAYDMVSFVCSRNNWSLSMFTYDVIVKVN